MFRTLSGKSWVASGFLLLFLSSNSTPRLTGMESPSRLFRELFFFLLVVFLVRTFWYLPVSHVNNLLFFCLWFAQMPIPFSELFVIVVTTTVDVFFKIIDNILNLFAVELSMNSLTSTFFVFLSFKYSYMLRKNLWSKAVINSSFDFPIDLPIFHYTNFCSLR